MPYRKKKRGTVRNRVKERVTETETQRKIGRERE